jgi:hypothetical protein
MREVMAEANFHFSIFEWITPEKLFHQLIRIFSDEDQAFTELSNAYYTNVKTVRVPSGHFRHLLWEKAEINAPEFCQTYPLVLWPNGLFSLRGDIPHRPRFTVFFSLKDAYARWPSLLPAALLSKEDYSDRARKQSKIIRAMQAAIERNEITLQELADLQDKELESRYGQKASRRTCVRARSKLLSKMTKKTILGK